MTDPWRIKGKTPAVLIQFEDNITDKGVGTAMEYNCRMVGYACNSVIRKPEVSAPLVQGLTYFFQFFLVVDNIIVMKPFASQKCM